MKKCAVILENSPDVELSRFEFDATAGPDGVLDDDDVDNKVSSILDGITFRVGDTIKIIEL